MAATALENWYSCGYLRESERAGCPRLPEMQQLELQLVHSTTTNRETCWEDRVVKELLHFAHPTRDSMK